MPDPADPERVVREVWGPQASLVRDGTPGWLAVPSAQRPSLLVPLESRAVAVAALRSASERSSRRARVRSAGLELLLRAGLATTVLRSRLRVDPGSVAGLQRRLAEVVGRPVQVGVRIGPPRANRKPVLALLDEAGSPVAFAKLSVGPLTQVLVDSEAATLRRWQAHEHDLVRAPRVLHLGDWHGARLLVLEALPLTGRERPPADRSQVHEVALAIAITEGQSSEPLSGSAYLTRLSRRIAALGPGPLTARLQQAVAELSELSAPTGSVRFGGWHGDFAPGNLRWGRPALVWDWERYERGVPVGFDALHYDFQSAVTVHRVPAPRAALDLVDAAPATLARFGVPDPLLASLLARAYLIELAGRYLTDGQTAAGSRIGAVGGWILPVLQRSLPGSPGRDRQPREAGT